MQKIKSINTISKLSDYEHLITSDTLILLDVDDTLITPQAKIFHMGADYQPLLSAKQKNPIDELKQLLPQNPQYMATISKWRLVRKVQLVEPQWPQIITEWKAKATVYALTKMDTGHYATIPSMEEWRYEELKKIGITFSDSLDEENIKILLEESSAVSNNSAQYAVFFHGIAMTGKYTKRQVAAKILALANDKSKSREHRFKNIVFIDDKLEMINEVKDLCAEINMNFLGLHYTGVERIPKNSNPEIVRLQQQRLFNDQVWLEDDQAMAELQAHLGQ